MRQRGDPVSAEARRPRVLAKAIAAQPPGRETGMRRAGGRATGAAGDG
jgi:hypothetical protein